MQIRSNAPHPTLRSTSRLPLPTTTNSPQKTTVPTHKHLDRRRNPGTNPLLQTTNTMKPRTCQSKRKDGNQCNANAMGGGYYCYVHKESKDPITQRDPILEANRELTNSMIKLINWHHRTGGDISKYFGKAELSEWLLGKPK